MPKTDNPTLSLVGQIKAASRGVKKYKHLLKQKPKPKFPKPVFPLLGPRTGIFMYLFWIDRYPQYREWGFELIDHIKDAADVLIGTSIAESAMDPNRRMGAVEEMVMIERLKDRLRGING